MKNKIDQFFKNKLEGHALPTSEEAWVKVDANLSKKNNIVVWRIAAAILIAGALVSLIILSQHSEDKNQPVIAAKKSPKDNLIKEKPAPQISSIEKKVNSTPRPVSSVISKKSPAPSSPGLSSQTESKSDQKESAENKISFATAFVEISEDKKTSEDKKPSFAKASEDKKINSEATPPVTIASTKRKPIKLEFTLEDFSEEEPVAKVSEEKNSGFRKVWDLALEVKNGEGPVHEIKNELFALSFKKNKNQ